jgi:hypothetical protein
LTLQVFANFLRSHHEYQKFFQVCRDCHGQAQFLKAEALFHYEHNSNYRIADATHEKLLSDVSDEDFVPYQLPGRIRCDEFDEFMKREKVDARKPEGKTALREFMEAVIPEAQQFVEKLADFVHIEARLPTSEKNYLPSVPIGISPDQSREEIINYLQGIRRRSSTADLAFYVYRDMESCDWTPFIKAAVERNPVSVQMVESMSVEEVYAWLEQMKNVSIYNGRRLAQPDEVANYKTGNGLEKAFLLANVIRQRSPEQDIEIAVDNNDVVLKGKNQYRFVSDKSFERQIRISTGGLSA